jgi:biotin synthase
MNTRVNKQEIMNFFNLSFDELIEVASKINKENSHREIEFCSLISAKTGKCGENCRYCAQSSHHCTNIFTHPLVSMQEVKDAALSSRDNGATRFSIVTSGRTPDKNDFSLMLKMIETIENIDGLHSCASLGILTDEQAKQLKNAGLTRYHHNINTCRSYHPSICTTHTYQDRIDTINFAKSNGLEICCGAIIGMGETMEQRAELIMELKEINPDSIPLNFLDPIKGTPFENYRNKIDEEDILRTIAVMRIAMPKISIRYAGGRLTRLSKDNQIKGILAGINALLVGNYLTTIGITPEEDVKMLESIGRVIVK